MITAIFFKSVQIPAKSTGPGPTIKSTALPMRIGRYKVSNAVAAAKVRDSKRSSR